MSQRPAVRTAFDNLRPTILRQPVRASISAEAESKMLETEPPAAPVQAKPLPTPAPESAPAFTGATLLSKKRREVLIPVTFRIPQSLKLQLEKVAQARELNQTDLINEGIALNLQRYQS